MKKKKKYSNDSNTGKKRARSADFTSPDTANDPTTMDDANDKTVKNKPRGKSKLEVNPDSTLPDADAEKIKMKTGKNNSPGQTKRK